MCVRTTLVQKRDLELQVSSAAAAAAAAAPGLQKRLKDKAHELKDMQDTWTRTPVSCFSKPTVKAVVASVVRHASSALVFHWQTPDFDLLLIYNACFVPPGKQNDRCCVRQMTSSSQSQVENMKRQKVKVRITNAGSFVILVQCAPLETLFFIECSS